MAPIEHLLARGAPAEPIASEPREASLAPTKASATPRKRGVSFNRRIGVAALIGALISSAAIAVAVMGGVQRPPRVPQSTVTRARPAKTPAKGTPREPMRRESPPGAAVPPPRETGVTLERAASDAFVEGRFAEAAQLYERLAESMPQMPVYKEAARILRERRAADGAHE